MKGDLIENRKDSRRVAESLEMSAKWRPRKKQKLSVKRKAIVVNLKRDQMQSCEL